MIQLKCNGCAWGMECPLRNVCGHWVSYDQWCSGVKDGQPNLAEAQNGYALLACDLNRLQHYTPIGTSVKYGHLVSLRNHFKAKGDQTAEHTLTDAISVFMNPLPAEEPSVGKTLELFA